MSLAEALAKLSEYCTCGVTKARDEGFTCVGVDWVCAKCRKPTRMYTQNVILPRVLKEHEK